MIPVSQFTRDLLNGWLSEKARRVTDAFENTGGAWFGDAPVKGIAKAFSPDTIDYSTTTDGPCAAACREVNRSIAWKIKSLRESGHVLKNHLLRMIVEYDKIPTDKLLTRKEVCNIRKMLLFYPSISQFEKELDVYEKTTELFIWYKYITKNNSLLDKETQDKINARKAEKGELFQGGIKKSGYTIG